MTVFTVYLDDRPQVAVRYDTAGNPIGWDLDDTDLNGLPDPMIAAAALLLDAEGDCHWPLCTRPVGLHLTEDDDGNPRDSWAPCAVVWDDGQRIVMGPDGYLTEPIEVLVLCEDHSPDSPYIAYDTAVGEAMAAERLADLTPDALLDSGLVTEVTQWYGYVRHDDGPVRVKWQTETLASGARTEPHIIEENP